MLLALYVAAGITLIVFGYLGLFSIGFPFLLTGVLMLAGIAFRRRAEVMVPVLLWPWAFTLVYVLVAPLGCTQVATPQVPGGGGIEGPTRCNGLFFSYVGDASYSPPIWPALLVGVVLATGAVLLVRRAMRGRPTPTAHPR